MTVVCSVQESQKHQRSMWLKEKVNSIFCSFGSPCANTKIDFMLKSTKHIQITQIPIASLPVLP